jgi:hypothetical protein
LTMKLNTLFLRFLSFIAFTLAITAKVLAQYGAPVMRFTFIGEIKSVECEEVIEGVEVTLINNATGQISKTKSSTDGKFSFILSDYFYDTEYVVLLADIDGNDGRGEFVSQEVRVQIPNDLNKLYNKSDENKLTHMDFRMDYKGKNPCGIVESPKYLPKEEKESSFPDDIDSLHAGPPTVPEESIVENSALLFPNPGDGGYWVRFTVEQSEKVNLAVFDINGNIVLNLYKLCVQGENIIDFNISVFPAGSYKAVLSTSTRTEHFKLIKI